MSKKGSGMVIANTGGGKDFEPDPVLDPKGDYEARIIGFVHIGVHQKDGYDDNGPTGKKEEIEQAIVAFELTEEETFVERGPEDNKKLVPRVMYKFLKWSSHENSNLFKIAAAASPDAAYMEGKEGRVDPVEMINEPVTLKLGLNKEKTKNNIKSAVSYPKKFQADVPEATYPLYCYSVDFGAHVGTIGDVTPWLLSFALDNAVNAEKFEDLDNLEAQIAKNEEAKEAAKEGSDKLEGDDKARTSRSKKSEESEPEEKVEKKSSSRRSRRGRSKKAEDVDYSDKSIEEMEDILLEKGLSEDDLNDIGDEFPDDDEYLTALVSKAQEA